MASKTHLLIFLSIAIMATSIADAQLPFPFPFPLPIPPRQITVNVSGIVSCSVNSTIGVAAPPFPNAAVQLQCPVGNTIATATTNSSGGFNLSVNLLQLLPLSIIPTCRVVVVTPLVNCNASLPSTGSLVSGPLSLVGLIVNSITGILNAVLLFLTGGLALTIS